jgi:hypothetical protein
MPKFSLLAAAMLSLWGSNAQADSEIDALRAEIREMRQLYETRLADLESRLSQATAQMPPPVQTAPPAQEREAAAANSANPEISLILQGRYSQLKPGERRPTGFLRDSGIGVPTRGFSLDDTELILAANIDPYFRGLANVVMADGNADVEEAWFQTLTLGEGLTLKGGRFISGIGYQNEQHPHAWDFADNNLMYQTLFGEHLVQDGLQLKWLAPTETFLELGAEIGRGGAFPGSMDGGDKNGPGDWALYGHVGGDVGESSAWRAGLSYLSAQPKNRESLVRDLDGVDTLSRFTGKSRTWIADFIWKWAPDGNPRSRNFKFQSEYFQRNESGELACGDADAALPSLCSGGSSDAYRARQSGWYAQGIYQLMPHWRVGLRYDRLNMGSLDYGANNAILLPANYHPNKWSLMTDYAPSEFSLFRLQLSRDHAMQGDPDNSQITLQYIYSLGPHGAHKF